MLLNRGRRVFAIGDGQYRARWSLPPSYPMVARALSDKRAALARRIKPHLLRKQARVAAETE